MSLNQLYVMKQFQSADFDQDPIVVTHEETKGGCAVWVNGVDCWSFDNIEALQQLIDTLKKARKKLVTKRAKLWKEGIDFNVPEGSSRKTNYVSLHLYDDDIKGPLFEVKPLEGSGSVLKILPRNGKESVSVFFQKGFDKKWLSKLQEAVEKFLAEGGEMA